MGSVPGLTHQVKDPTSLRAVVLVADMAQILALLWLWPKPASTAPTGPLAWELPHTMGVVLKGKKKKKS